LPRLAGKPVIFIADSVVPAAEVLKVSKDYQISTPCVRLISRTLLAEVKLDEGWGDTPLTLEPRGLGRMREVVRRLEMLSHFNVRVYLPAATIEDCINLRLLSSLGINCCANVAGNPGRTVQWKALKDLAVYSLYTRRPIGEIDPFTYISRHYNGCGLVDFRSVYFNDPSKYLHVDEEGRLSLTREDQSCGVFLEVPVEDYRSVRDTDCFANVINAWKSYFIERNQCSECEGWRVCIGAFSHYRDPGCAEVFGEVLAGAEHYRQVQKRQTLRWQL
jgi:hypothetical protein